MRECLKRARPEHVVHLAWVTCENALSFRQMTQLLPEGPDIALKGAQAFEELCLSRRYCAIVTSRMFKGLNKQLANPAISAAQGRPCVIGFLGGLEFFPETAHHHRRLCDALYLFPNSARMSCETGTTLGECPHWQRIGFGHPAAIRPLTLPEAVLARRDKIYFFPQALSPNTRRGRLHMLRALIAMARANPSKTFVVKLRHLPEENRTHLHREIYDYPALLKTFPPVPANLEVTACTMAEALSDAALGVTCTSTAAIDLVREGIPCMVHLDFFDNFMDPLVHPMRQLFANSGLITSLEDMLHLKAAPPNPEWVTDMFCPDDLGERVYQDIVRFAERPFQVAEVL